MNHKPDFTVVEKTDEFLLIEDMCRYNTDGGMSVTNGAEYVVKYLYENGHLRERRLFYIDTEGRVDELIHDERGNFVDFKFGYDNLLEFYKHHDRYNKK